MVKPLVISHDRIRQTLGKAQDDKQVPSIKIEEDLNGKVQQAWRANLHLVKSIQESVDIKHW